MSEQEGKKDSRDKGDFYELLKIAIAAGSILSAAALYYFQRTDSEKTTARTRTLEQISEYLKGDVSKSKSLAENFFSTKVRPLAGGGVSESDKEKIYAYVASQDAEGFVKYKDNMKRLLEHLDYVSFCAQRDVCDIELVTAFYCAEYSNIVDAAEPTIKDFQANKVTIGGNAAEFFKSNCTASQSTMKAGAGAN
ncbi:MAG: hypothetical protein ACKVP5_13450 [Aestuariivirga sp.]